MSSRVAIIGGGSSGVVAVKVMAEAGFSHIVCFERRDVIGGLWHYTGKDARWTNEGSVNRGTVINTSKEIMAFSDFPMPDDYPNFCHNTMIDKYINSYATHFGVHKYLRLNTDVTSVKKHRTFDSTGQWEVTSQDLITSKSLAEVFDFVIVANGRSACPKLPWFPGQDKFKGKIMHSKDFKDSARLEDKKVCVVGVGNSGADIACELGNYRQVLLSVRSGAWLFNRLTHKGLPFDLVFHSRYRYFLYNLMPRALWNWLKKQSLNQAIDHTLYGLRPADEPDAFTPRVTDDVHNRIACGKIKVKPNIRHFSENGITFEDGSQEDNVDVVIFATGYTHCFPFLDSSLLGLTKEDNVLQLYKHMFVADMSQHTLVFLAGTQMIGAAFPTAELQSRLAAGVFKKEIPLPSLKQMQEELARYQEHLRSLFVGPVRLPYRKEYLPYTNELASLIGCKPNLAWYLLTDPVLFWHLWFGPGVAYQYRLQGPNPWPKARHAILTAMDRIRKPFEKTLELHKSKEQGSLNFIMIVLSVFLLASFGLFCM